MDVCVLNFHKRMNKVARIDKPFKNKNDSLQITVLKKGLSL